MSASDLPLGIARGAGAAMRPRRARSTAPGALRAASRS